MAPRAPTTSRLNLADMAIPHWGFLLCATQGQDQVVRVYDLVGLEFTEVYGA